MSSPDLKNRRIALISVYDKQGVDTLARALTEQYGYTILSTGGTRKFLEEQGIPAIETSSITGFEELLGGRVKSLHPEIFAAILAEQADRMNGKAEALPFLIDTVVVNLYPFEEQRKQQDDLDALLHYIDIGGSALIRAAAKNFPAVNVLSDPGQYETFLRVLAENQGHSTLEVRRMLAAAAFQQSAYYDALVARTVDPDEAALEDRMTLPLRKIQDLRYGENPHQMAGLYGLATDETEFECLHGKELSYNNILDMEAAWNIVSEFTENPACVIVKHNNPCGVAISPFSQKDAFKRALDADPLSAFGGIVAFNMPLGADTVKELKDIFLEVIVAPDFEPEAYEVLSAKKNLRLVKRPLKGTAGSEGLQYKQVSDDLFLVQGINPDKAGAFDQLMQVVTEAKPSQDQLEDMIFAWRVVKHVKSNAIVLAKNGKTVGIGGGQTSRIGALENALKTACDEAKDAVMASDGFLPHIDNIHAVVQARVGAIIQPGGSVKDKDVIELANKYAIPMVNTGIREFRH